MASWTARRCRRRRRGPMRRGAMKRRAERWRRGWPPCGPRCCRWSGSAARITFLSWGAVRCWRWRCWRGCGGKGCRPMCGRCWRGPGWPGLREPVQVVWRRAPLVVEEVAPEEAGGDVAGQLRARAERRQYRLDVRQAPLLRGVCVQDGGRWLLLLWSHHLAIDHTTLEVLQEEIQAH